MRTYFRNSPEAAGRIVALVMIADGNVCRSELVALQRLDAERTLGLAHGALPRLLQDLCEDLMASAHASPSLLASVDEAALASMMAEVSEPWLQHEVLRLAQAAAQADHHRAEGEAFVLAAARRHWGIESERQETLETDALSA
jgi:uncharacterized tellurite resistance protein B-like protein